MKKHRIGWVLIIGLVALLGGPFIIPLPMREFNTPEELVRPGGQIMIVNGTRVYVETAGPVAGPAVILIHGFGVSSYSWRFTLPALGNAGYHAIAIDWKGFGLSDKKFEADYSHAAQADLVAGVMGILNIQHASIVGHSMGSNVLAHFALKYPDRAEKLVIVDGVIIEENEGANWTSVLWFPPARRWAQLAFQWFVVTPQTTADWLRAAYYDPTHLTPEVLNNYLAPQTVRDWDLALLGIIRDSNQNALPRPFSTITAPTMIIWGENDPWIPLSVGEKLHARLPQSEWVVFSKTGHMLMEEQPSAFNERLLKFLQP
jgi:pimeloyl-ACP methyl ester carboxylesterase